MRGMMASSHGDHQAAYRVVPVARHAVLQTVEHRRRRHHLATRREHVAPVRPDRSLVHARQRDPRADVCGASEVVHPVAGRDRTHRVRHHVDPRRPRAGAECVGFPCDCPGDVDVRRAVAVVDGVDLGVAVPLGAQRGFERVPPAARAAEAVYEEDGIGSRRRHPRARRRRRDRQGADDRHDREGEGETPEHGSTIRTGSAEWSSPPDGDSRSRSDGNVTRCSCSCATARPTPTRGAAPGSRRPPALRAGAAPGRGPRVDRAGRRPDRREPVASRPRDGGRVRTRRWRSTSAGSSSTTASSTVGRSATSPPTCGRRGAPILTSLRPAVSRW